MKLHFEPDLDFQHEAIEAVCDLFRGQDVCRTEFTVTAHRSSPVQLVVFASNDLGVGNHLTLPNEKIFEKLKKIEHQATRSQVRQGPRPTPLRYRLELLEEGEAKVLAQGVLNGQHRGCGHRIIARAVGATLLSRMPIRTGLNSVLITQRYGPSQTSNLPALRLIQPARACTGPIWICTASMLTRPAMRHHRPTGKLMSTAWPQPGPSGCG